MLTTRVTFEDKVSEVEEYYKFLRDVVVEDAIIYRPNKKTWKHRPFEDDLQKILKANCFLLLYNLVESSIRGGVRDLYDAIGADGLSYEKLAAELRSVWVKQKYRELGQTAHPDRYRDLAKELIDLAMDKTAIQFSSTRLPQPGNLDARTIRELCGNFGIPFQTHRRSRGGEKLETVRKMRNNLAHGLETFSECGRSYSFDDLDKIKNEVVIYLRGITKNIDNHISNNNYKI